MIGIEDQYDDDDYAEEYDYSDTPSYEPVRETETTTNTASSYANTEYSSSYEEPKRNTTSRSNVMDMGSVGGSSRMRISIQEPIEYNDGQKVLDSISQARTVVLNLEMPEVAQKRQILDFVCGGVYALKGQIQKVTKDIYVIVPKGVDVDAAIRQSVEDNASLYQL